ncbi:type VI secretion system baseplate subunit TssE [Plastoroseomonas hellenica]|uniref:Type VI secretion system baseplate subunit TssE n=1 Tax=Plastoroseomonas hellenica TaxID=2687306 RepID=A0ABS5F5S3_9PROT|nr:type VI secretion system baseplate subunit TssE [Plastoroseomonas hellenica]MBR0645939.1 type VI secretion system baseplate subunit TssE [Plastoroseomonas hellenica]MBR0667891.1 type VI secretion system baseplate subunit TssE [Plastoroseomonas hellenica]
MGETRSAARLRLPLLDRLLDADPEAPADPPLTQGMAIEMLRAAVRRDIEALLNARRRRLPPPPGYVELPISPVGYGVPDPTAGSFTEEQRRLAVAREVEATIRRFEPRLMQVRVQLRNSEREAIDRVLRLRIEAVLRTDPVPEQISFETVVRPTTLDVAVREG